MKTQTRILLTALALLTLAASVHAQGFTNSLGMKFVPVPGTKVLFATTETTMKQWQAMGRGDPPNDNPGLPSGPDYPVVNTTWNDANSFCQWLSQKEEKKYRLPTDCEWSCAVGLGSMEKPGGSPLAKRVPDVFPWGPQAAGSPPPTGAGNYAGQEMRQGRIESIMQMMNAPSWTLIAYYRDNHPFAAPVRSYRPNALGIYDRGGNVSEWCQDKVPRGVKNIGGGVPRVLRGASWLEGDRERLLASSRISCADSSYFPWIGFRVVCAQ